PRRGPVWSSKLTEEALRLYGEGCSCASIGRQLKINPETVRQHLLAAGQKLRRPGRPSPRTWPHYS
ncbi:MAG TPA: helix-turn-helix transcriptional regulator, partial [Acidimicrobiales bacterium]|nr:helix-turn-helix transcriptional regulator [Acidimicrobiales bacterium]